MTSQTRTLLLLGAVSLAGVFVLMGIAQRYTRVFNERAQPGKARTEQAVAPAASPFPSSIMLLSLY